MFLAAPFFECSFAEKKDSKNGAARKLFGPSYFDPTLVFGRFISSDTG